MFCSQTEEIASVVIGREERPKQSPINNIVQLSEEHEGI